MHAHDRAVDHLHLAVVGFHDGVHQAVPDAILAPAVEAIVGRRVRPVSLGKIAPGCTGAQNPEDTVENLAVVLRLHSPPPRRQERLDDAPLEVGQVVAHDPSSDVSQLESLFESRGPAKIEYMTLVRTLSMHGDVQRRSFAGSQEPMRGRRRAKIMPPSKGGRHIAMRVAICARFSSDLQDALSIPTRSPWRTQHVAKQHSSPRSSRTPRSRVPHGQPPRLETCSPLNEVLRSANVYSGRKCC
jgi:hypothetical protein